MTSDTMSLSCQISCFPPDCIKENIRQLALGELLVQKKLRQQTSISLMFCIVPCKGTIHLCLSHLRLLFDNFFHCQIDITPTAFFPSPLSYWEHQNSLWQTRISHSSLFSQVPLWAALRSKGCANPKAVSTGCPAALLTFLNSLKNVSR